MYGTIARAHPKPDALAKLREYAGEFNSGQNRRVPGFVASYIFTPDQKVYDRETVFLVAIFEDEATYKANADSPAQHEDYVRMRALLEDDPDWMDGTFETM
jgi:heme-degrading monooxygenase HmoA